MTSMRQWVDAYSDEFVMGDESNGLLTMDGYDDCIVGIATRFGPNGTETFVVYDREKVIQKLMKHGIADRDDAVDFHHFNQADAYHGKHTPAFLDTPETEDAEG